MSDNAVTLAATTDQRSRPSAAGLARRTLLVLSFGAIGIAFAVLVMGRQAMDPQNISWMSRDPQTGYLGWTFFRLENALRIPLGWSSTIGFPNGEALAYFDGVPLFAVMLWPFRHVLPDVFQYYGLYFALCSVLQLTFGYRICMRVTGGHRSLSFLGGLLFMWAPVFFVRATGHFALCSHWVLLAALEFFVALILRPKIEAAGVAAGAVICFMVGAINPYIALMVSLVVGAAYAHVYIMAPSEWRRVDAGLMVAAFAMIASMVLFGFIGIGNAGSYPGWGYGRFAMNLLGVIDPMNNSGLLLKAQPTAIPEAGEGYAYLGLGVILLLAVCVSRKPGLIRDLFRKRMIAVWLVVVVSTLLALSLRAVGGDVVMYDITGPQWLMTVLSWFRTSGRLFWPAYYLIFIGAVFAASRAFDRRVVGAVLIATLAIQVTDLNGSMINVAKYHRELVSAPPFTDGVVWRSLSKTYRHIVTLPSWQCDAASAPGGVDGFWTFGKLAVEEKMTINSFYAGRVSPKQIEYFCFQLPKDTASQGLDPQIAYVFTETFARQFLPSVQLHGHFCAPQDGVVLCRSDLGKEGLDDSLRP